MRRSFVTSALIALAVLLVSSTAWGVAPRTRKPTAVPSPSRKAVSAQSKGTATAESTATPVRPAETRDTTASAGGHESKQRLLDRLRQRLRESPKTPDYDRLIDNDNDGIDDRLQRSAPADSAAPAASPPPDSAGGAPPKKRG